MDRKRLIFLIKIALSAAIFVGIYSKIASREGADELTRALASVKPIWLVVAALTQLGAITCGITRWNLLLGGQGIHAPLRHLIGSWFIGRFFGGFAPGGWTGLNGYRLYDIAKQTGKTARSAASIGIEMVLGWIGFGSVVVMGSIFGLELLGSTGVILVDAFFLGLTVAAVTLISRPTLFRVLANYLPQRVRARLQTAIDAICAYQGKAGRVSKAALLSMGIHVFHNLTYVATAHALGVDLHPGLVFFASSIQIFATLVPASVNGIGLREAAAMALYAQVGVSTGTATLIATLGFTVEMFISAFGGLVFLARRVGYRVKIEVENADHEEFVTAKLEPTDPASWPRLSRGALLGASGGLLGGALLGIGEAVVTIASGADVPDYTALAYGAVAYGSACALGGLGLGVASALSGRMMQRAALAEPRAFGVFAGLFAALGALPIAAFRIRRDGYQEALVWKSGEGLLVLGGCVLSAVVLYLVLSTLLRLLAERSPGRLLLRAWGVPALLGLGCAAFMTAASLNPADARASVRVQRPAAPAQAGNVLFLVVDTVRADHLPVYGYTKNETPHLEAFAKDAIRFNQAFSNASWTRPSFASLMTGRYPSSHNTMAKSASLPSDPGLVTLAEALQAGGYTTLGVVTNYNVAPFFNFQQGFDDYRYLTPEFVLGAGDTAAKLLFVQALRNGVEGFKAKRGLVEPNTAYRDGKEVNAEVLKLLDENRAAKPVYMFVGYMDPHDPYYPHPYDGTGYSRAAHQSPKPEEAELMRKLYDGEIRYWDEVFGELVAALKQRKLYDDLTIVVTSDHGEEFMEHGGFWHGTTLYDEQVRVPLLLKLPGREGAGTVRDNWVQSIDIMPSLLTRAGIEVPAGVQGKDLMLDTEQLLAEEDHEGNQLRALRLRRGGQQVKLIEANEGNPRGLEPFELYRMDQDPQELVNLAKQDAELVTLAATELDRQQKAASEGRVEKANVDLTADANAVEKMRALGYAGGETKQPDPAPKPD
jgi:uncharacterized protein (TIRG00374 family)